MFTHNCDQGKIMRSDNICQFTDSSAVAFDIPFLKVTWKKSSLILIWHKSEANSEPTQTSMRSFFGRQLFFQKSSIIEIRPGSKYDPENTSLELGLHLLDTTKYSRMESVKLEKQPLKKFN